MKPLLASAVLLLTACQGTTVQQGETLYINSQLVDCVGVGPMQCMQVRSDEQQPWTLFYQNIEGFQFEPGYRYQLTVSKEQLTDVPADAPLPALSADQGGEQGRQQVTNTIKKRGMADAIPPLVYGYCASSGTIRSAPAPYVAADRACPDHPAASDPSR